MRYQQLGWSCGPAAIVNAARVLGRKVAERTVRKLAGTTEADGTDDAGMIAGLRGVSLTAVEHSSGDAAAAWAFVRANVLDGRPCLLCIDNWRHWVTVIGIVGDMVLVADPATSQKNVDENGVTVMSRTSLARRWRCRNEDEPFYAIAAGK